MTIIANIDGAFGASAKLLTLLKNRLGCGGIVKDTTVELQVTLLCVSWLCCYPYVLSAARVACFAHIDAHTCRGTTWGLARHCY